MHCVLCLKKKIREKLKPSEPPKLKFEILAVDEACVIYYMF